MILVFASSHPHSQIDWSRVRPLTISLLVALQSTGDISALALEDMVSRFDDGDAVLRRALTDFLTDGSVERLRTRFLEVAAEIDGGVDESDEGVEDGEDQ